LGVVVVAVKPSSMKTQKKLGQAKPQLFQPNQSVKMDKCISLLIQKKGKRQCQKKGTQLLIPPFFAYYLLISLNSFSGRGSFVFDIFWAGV